MLRLPPFEYLAPKNIDEAVKLLEQHGDDAMLVAGGTDVFPNMKRRLIEPSYVIGLNALSELRGVADRDGLVIGAGTTLTQLSNHPTKLFCACPRCVTRLHAATSQHRHDWRQSVSRHAL